MTGFAPWQQRVYRHAADAIDAGRLGHGLLFCGPERMGKRVVAERLAQRLLCTDRGTDGEPCDQCRGCSLYRSRSQRDPLEERPDSSLAHPDGHPGHPDAVFVGYAWRFTPSPPRQQTVISVEQMRVLSERLGKTAQYGGAQIALIEPADALNEAAANALLKTLEEPVAGRYLWLVSAHPARLPATIRSRCQMLEFRLPPRAEAQAWLVAQGHAGELAGEALDAARGHPGLANEWLQGHGLQLRREVADDLAKLARGGAAAVETAQRWASDDDAELRLRFAADLAVEEMSGDLTDPKRARSLAEWFDKANGVRALLGTTVRVDLAIAELLMARRGFESRRTTGGRA